MHPLLTWARLSKFNVDRYLNHVVASSSGEYDVEFSTPERLWHAIAPVK